jgi:hypothetical protein
MITRRIRKLARIEAIAFGDDWFRLQPNFGIATSAFDMDMWSFARRSFIGEEEITEATFAKEMAPKGPSSEHYSKVREPIPDSPTPVRDPLLPAALTMLTACRHNHHSAN